MTLKQQIHTPVEELPEDSPVLSELSETLRMNRAIGEAMADVREGRTFTAEEFLATVHERWPAHSVYVSSGISHRIKRCWISLFLAAASFRIITMASCEAALVAPSAQWSSLTTIGPGSSSNSITIGGLSLYISGTGIMRYTVESVNFDIDLSSYSSVTSAFIDFEYGAYYTSPGADPINTTVWTLKGAEGDGVPGGGGAIGFPFHHPQTLTMALM